MQQRHIIQKQMIEVDATTAVDGLAFQREVSSWNERLMPALEALFDEYGNGRHISIEKLVVSVDSVMQEGWVDVAIKSIVQQVEHELRELQHLDVTDEHISVRHAPGIAARLVEQWLYFLEHGHLPWYGVTEDVADEVKLTEAVKLTTVTENKIERIRSLLAKQAPRTRFINQFSASFVTEVIKILSKDDMVLPRLLGRIEKKYSRQIALDAVLQLVSKEISFASVPEAISQIEMIVSPQETKRSRSQKKQQQRRKESKPANDEIVSHKNLQEQASTLSDLDNNSNSPVQAVYPQPSETTESQKKTELIKKLFSRSVNNNEEELETEGIYIENAGLIIAAPFLSNFLQHCGLMKNGALTDPSQAAYLLQNLVTGSPIAKEYELSLNKILCGLDVNFVLNPCEPVTTDQSVEAEQLLSAIIKYWTIIKNTSIEGLRESFLQRNGKLTRKGDDWLLQVEQKSYDMLLEHLPWTISMIRLPFMQCTLNVEWI